MKKKVQVARTTRTTRRVQRPRKLGAVPRLQENVLIPSGVNNRATMPTATQTYTFSGEEVVGTFVAPPDAAIGTKFFNRQISHDVVARLALISRGFQRVKWHQCHLHLVALNGSTTTSGYTAGFYEDPEIEPPADGSAVIPALTALRTTAVRQNWVESTTGMILKLSDLPEMYTTRGSDIRRFAIGRYVAALTGPPGPGTTFQLMLKYHVTMSVPQVLAVETTGAEYTMLLALNAGIAGNSNSTGGGTLLPARATQPPSSLTAVPPAGEWICPGGCGFLGFTTGPTTQSFPPDPDNGSGLADDRAWQLFVRDNLTWTPVWSIIVTNPSDGWSAVRFRTDEGSELRPWNLSTVVTPLSLPDVDGYGCAFIGNQTIFQPFSFGDFTSSGYPVDFPHPVKNPPIIPAGAVLQQRAIPTSTLTEDLVKQLYRASLSV